jgi:RNA polymerase sigma factor (sigma-70 family)
MSVTASALEIVRSSRVASRSDLPAEFWELVERYRGELVNQALAVTGNIDDAEEVVQETFCEAFRHSEKMKDVRSLGAWLRSINQSNALDYVRGSKRIQNKAQRKQNLAPDRIHTTGGFSMLEMRDMIAKAVENLNPNMRTAVVMCYWQHLSPDEIANRMNVSARTVRRLLFEAALLLHGKLGPYLSALPAAPEAASDTKTDSGTTLENEK